MVTKKVEITEFIEKMNEIKKWEDDNYKKTGQRRLPDYVIFKDGFEALIDDWLDAVKRYSSWMAQNKVVPNYVIVKIRDKNTSAPGKQVYYYPTSTFNQNVGNGCFGCTWIPNKTKKHCGVDVDRGDVGRDVRSIADGKVIYVTDPENVNDWDYGVGIKHNILGETYYTISWHLEKIKVKKGQTVKAGQKLGVIGKVDPGQYTGVAHLHFGVSKSFSTKGALYPSEFPGTFIEPFAFLKKIGAKK